MVVIIPLHDAASKGDIDIARFLLERGASVEIKNNVLMGERRVIRVGGDGEGY